LQKSSDNFFIEIGSCDFDTCLPLAKQGWRGIVVEANPEIFSSVREMFKGTAVQCLNCAVTDFNGNIDIKLAVGQDWVRGISHVVHQDHMGNRLSDHPSNKDNYGGVATVLGVALNSLVEACGVSQVDFLKIDTEGHEINILKNYNWRVRPKFIKVEHRLTDDLLLCEILNKQGYITWTEANDIYAVG